MMFILVLVTERFRISINGDDIFLNVGPVTILITAVMLLYVPLYGGIIYKYKGGKTGALIKSILWILIPCTFVFFDQSKSVAFIMAISMLAQLTIAIMKGWITVSKVPVILGLWSTFLLTPVIARLGDIINIDAESYELRAVRELTSESGLFGGRSEGIYRVLPNIDSDYILTYITSTWGVIAVLAVIALVGGLLVSGFITLSKSKNQLGMVMGSGCLMTLLVSAILNMGAAFGIIPYLSSFFPFISSGGSNLIVSYAFLGMILCIYKYKNAYPQHIDISISDRIRFRKKFKMADE